MESSLRPTEIFAHSLFDEGRADAAGPLVSAVMPCLNEARTVGRCVAKARTALAQMGINGEVIVADNGPGKVSGTFFWLVL